MEEKTYVEVNLQGATGQFPLEPKTFKSGRKGFNSYGKLYVKGEKYMWAGNLIKIGSKKNPKTAKSAV